MSIYPYPGRQRLTATSWPQRLRSATSEQEVVDIARDFVATFSPYELARLPSELRPGRFVDGNDVADFAFNLVRQDHDDAEGTARCIHKMTHFFTQASVRLSEVKSRATHFAKAPRANAADARRGP